MTISLAQFRIRFPQWADTALFPNELVQMVLDEAALRCSLSFFGSKQDSAHTYLSAHIMVCSLTQLGSGVTSASAAGASITNAIAAGATFTDPTSLGMTGYGRMYRDIVRTIGGARLV